MTVSIFANRSCTVYGLLRSASCSTGPRFFYRQHSRSTGKIARYVLLISVSTCERTDMFSWYAELTNDQKRAFWACYGGWALDGMDVQLYTFLIPPLIVLWHMSGSEAGFIASSALITSAIGGWLAGIFADRYGRVRMLQITILWYSVFTAACGLTNSFGQLLVMRSLQGFGFGGEWTVGAVLIGEIVRASDRGKAVGTIQSGWAIDWGIAALLSTLALSALPPSWGWRALFLVGVVPALLIFFIRRYVDELKIFLERSAARQASLQGGIRRIFSRDLLRARSGRRPSDQAGKQY